MPQEDRRIIFSYEEVYKALFALCVKRELKKPPPGNLISVVQDENDRQKIVIKVNNHQNNTSNEVVYSRDFLAASLMLYCRGAGIPLPKSASKSVMINDDNVVLRATM
jgi:hypothetical protein